MTSFKKYVNAEDYQTLIQITDTCLGFIAWGGKL